MGCDGMGIGSLVGLVVVVVRVVAVGGEPLQGKGSRAGGGFCCSAVGGEPLHLLTLWTPAGITESCASAGPKWRCSDMPTRCREHSAFVPPFGSTGRVRGGGEILLSLWVYWH